MLGCVTHWKLLLLPLAVLLPLLAYVAGTLSIGPEGPTRPEPVILRDADTDDDAGTRDPQRRREDRPDARRQDPAARGDDDQTGDNGRDHGEDDDLDDDTRDDDAPEIVLPRPTRLDDDDDGADDDGADDGDDDFEGDDDGGDD